ncbi:hypothetical protein ANH9381_1159 [Aggregatibacter actinomycetemcomitans ANH9381]|nr:hypothetical protein ANH9381_1159 [Aggregatibacter actinomycetemcomitans ANH9381]
MQYVISIKFLEIRENNLENLHHFYIILREENIVLNKMEFFMFYPKRTV